MGVTTAVSPACPQINSGLVRLISDAAALGGFLPGRRSLPRAIRAYRLIWRPY
jgi:hypothetical protein